MVTWKSPGGIFAIRFSPFVNKLLCYLFSENAFKASSSRNRIWDRVGSDEEEAPERRGFQVRVDLRLGAIDTTNVN